MRSNEDRKNDANASNRRHRPFYNDSNHGDVAVFSYRRAFRLVMQTRAQKWLSCEHILLLPEKHNPPNRARQNVVFGRRERHRRRSVLHLVKGFSSCGAASADVGYERLSSEGETHTQFDFGHGSSGSFSNTRLSRTCGHSSGENGFGAPSGGVSG